MEHNDTDTNSSLFPIFNFAALKQPNRLLHSNFSPNDLKISEDLIQQNLLQKDEPETLNKKRGRRSSRKSDAPELDSSKLTLKKILENDRVGIPTQADRAMKEEKLKKMKEGKERRKALKTRCVTTEDDPNLVGSAPTLDQSDGAIQQPQSNIVAQTPKDEYKISTQIVIKDGKPVIFGLNMHGGEDKKGKLELAVASKPSKVTSMSFRSRNHTKRWTEEETKRFYKAIEIFGSDFSLITKLFPARNRAQIKNKLHKEEKENPAKVHEAFKKHERPGQKSLIARIKNRNHKELNGEFEQLSKIDSLESLDSLDSRNRSASNYSLDSTDNRIIDDLKEIIKESSFQSNKAPIYSKPQHNLKLEAPPLEVDLTLNKENHKPNEVAAKMNESRDDSKRGESSNGNKDKNLLLNLFK